jgi:signal transduction histidine kinase
MTGARLVGRAWFGSIRFRIFAVVAGLLLMSSLASVFLLRALLLDQLDVEVERQLDAETEEVMLLRDGNDPDTGRPFAGDLRAFFDLYFAREVPDEGEALLAFVDDELYLSSRAKGAAAAGDLDAAIDYWLSVDEIERSTINTPLGEARYVAIPMDGQPEDGVFVVVNFPAFERDEINQAVETFIWVQLAAMLVAGVLGLSLAGRVLRPLRRLVDTARRISDTDLSQRIPVTGQDEASDIATTFNDMLARLEHAFTMQRQFLDETSHELRTPLTVIQGNLELLHLDSPEERRRTVDLVMDELDRMEHLVNHLFLLARAEHPEFLTMTATDARHVVTDVHRKAAALGERDWRLEVAEEVPIIADTNRLAQALLQLADNAVKHTTPGDQIRIGTGHVDGNPHLWVDDQGTGIPPEDEERIFRRFTRGTTSTDDKGAGLGLAIVSAIAAAHGGNLSLKQRPGPGARFEITLPPAQDQPAHHISARRVSRRPHQEGPQAMSGL